MTEHRAEIPDELARLIEGGAGLSAIAFRAANAERTDVFDAIEDVLDTADIIATPTLAVAEVPNAPAFGRTQRMEPSRSRNGSFRSTSSRAMASMPGVPEVRESVCP